MKILVAEDDGMTRLALVKNLEKWGYQVIDVEDGQEAFSILTTEDPPRVAILDWLMPGMEGIEICQKLIHGKNYPLIYTILLTIKKGKEDIVKALNSGAYDFLSKPVHVGELQSRITVGVRLIQAEEMLRNEIMERKQAEKEKENLIEKLQEVLKQVKTLSGLLPICANCKKIRDDKGYWNIIEAYVAKYSEAEFSHGMCPECMDKLYGDQKWYKKNKQLLDTPGE